MPYDSAWVHAARARYDGMLEVAPRETTKRGHQEWLTPNFKATGFWSGPTAGATPACSAQSNCWPPRPTGQGAQRRVTWQLFNHHEVSRNGLSIGGLGAGLIASNLHPLVIVQTTSRHQSGPAPVLFRSGGHARRPSVRRPRVISRRVLSVFGAGCRSR